MEETHDLRRFSLIKAPCVDRTLQHVSISKCIFLISRTQGENPQRRKLGAKFDEKPRITKGAHMHSCLDARGWSILGSDKRMRKQANACYDSRT